MEKEACGTKDAPSRLALPDGGLAGLMDVTGPSSNAFLDSLGDKGAVVAPTDRLRGSTHAPSPATRARLRRHRSAATRRGNECGPCGDAVRWACPSASQRIGLRAAHDRAAATPPRWATSGADEGLVSLSAHAPEQVIMQLTLHKLGDVQHLTLKAAAAACGMSATTVSRSKSKGQWSYSSDVGTAGCSLQFKKQCRKIGVPRWFHRKHASLSRLRAVCAAATAPGCEEVVHGWVAQLEAAKVCDPSLGAPTLSLTAAPQARLVESPAEPLPPCVKTIRKWDARRQHKLREGVPPLPEEGVSKLA